MIHVFSYEQRNHKAMEIPQEGDVSYNEFKKKKHLTHTFQDKNTIYIPICILLLQNLLIY